MAEEQTSRELLEQLAARLEHLERVLQAQTVRGMQMFQRGGPEGERGMSPGLPGGVMGGGQGPTREPPR